jgi:lyso-ornithine lipid O-acyltransferase
MEAAVDLLLSPVAALRAVVRLILLSGCVGISWLRHFISGPQTRQGQANWLSAWARDVVNLLGLRVIVQGAVPKSGLIVSNHLGYLDIAVLSAVARCVFVSKREVADLPIFGPSARWCGTIFVDRSRRADVAEVAAAMRDVLGDGVPVVLFPEGTSSGGEQVLPFKPALFAPVVELGCPVAACALDYSLPSGSVPDEVCYWGDDKLSLHFFNLFGKTGLVARISFGPLGPRHGDRKDIARELHAEVVALRELAMGESRA